MRKFKTITWHCYKCLSTWDVLAVIIDDVIPHEHCTTCRSEDTRKIITAPSVKFIGSGFYETDYK